MEPFDKLVRALRCKRDDCEGCDISFFDKDEGWMCQYAAKDADAADAIEALQAEQKKTVTQIFGEEQQKWTEYCTALGNRIKELEQQLPKRGKWIRHPEVKNIYGGEYIECPFCGEKYVVQNVSDEKFCRNCGADLRAKMEVQE